MVQEDDGDWRIVDGLRTNSYQGSAQVGKRFEHHDELRPAAHFATEAKWKSAGDEPGMVSTRWNSRLRTLIER